MEFLTGYIVFFVCLALIYGGLMYWYVQGWRDLPAWEPPPDFEPNTRISVVIPARNEAACITACLRAIQQNRYPPALLEVLVVDDFSEDTTATEVSRFAQTAWMDVRLLPLSGAPHPRMGGKKRPWPTGSNSLGARSLSRRMLIAWRRPNGFIYWHLHTSCKGLPLSPARS